jgi:hypothetical protein
MIRLGFSLISKLECMPECSHREGRGHDFRKILHFSSG